MCSILFAMGTVRKIGNDYYVEFYARGLRYQRNGGPNKEGAKRLLKDIEDKIQKGEMGTAAREIETDVFLKDLCKQLRDEHSPKTFSRYISVIGHFQKFCHTKLPLEYKLSQVTPHVIEEYRSFLVSGHAQGVGAIKPKVINLTLHLLKDIFDYGVKLGHINDNPTFHVRFAQVSSQGIPQILSADDVDKFFKSAPLELKDIVMLFLKTGMRRDELIGLKWANIDVKNNCLKIKSSIGISKGASGIRQIPMDSEVTKIFHRLYKKKLANDFVCVDQSGRKLNKEQLASDCGSMAEGRSLHGSDIFNIFRHTFAKDMLQKGVSLVGLYKLLGFSDIAGVMRYEGFTINRGRNLN